MVLLNKGLPLSLLFLLLLTLTLISSLESTPKSRNLLPQRKVLSSLQEDEDQPSIINKKTTLKTPSKNHTKFTISKNQATLVKTPSISSKKSKSNPSNSTSSPIPKSQFKKLNSTTNSTAAPDKPKKPTTKKDTKAQIQMGPNKPKSNQTLKKQPNPNSEDDLVSDFRHLPQKFQESFVPDLEIITESSKNYINKYNKEFTKGFKPYFGNKYAPAVASFISFALIVIPLILVSLIFNRIKAYFSLQKLLIFIQIYLAIYFAILCLSAVATGLEPLRFFYATARNTYVCVQVLQTLAYVLYLLLLLMYLVLVFSTETVMVTKLLGLGQTLVGFAVGLHYYMTVFHKAVLRQQPNTSWKAHGLYATCFIVICLVGRVDTRKKAYVADGGEEGKKS